MQPDGCVIKFYCSLAMSGHICLIDGCLHTAAPELDRLSGCRRQSQRLKCLLLSLVQNKFADPCDTVSTCMSQPFSIPVVSLCCSSPGQNGVSTLHLSLLGLKTLPSVLGSSLRTLESKSCFMS